eukprot:1158867-Pelagomonas_calceolata.AAC.2
METKATSAIHRLHIIDISTHTNTYTRTHLRQEKVSVSYIQSFMQESSLAWGTAVRAEATGGGRAEAEISTKGASGLW